MTERTENTPNPKYLAIYNELRKSILAGHYGDDGRLPTEKDLMEQYQVSRTTIRRATELLRKESLVESRQGRGTDISLGNLYQNEGQKNRLTEILHVNFAFLTDGPEITKHSDILADLVMAKTEVAEALDIPNGENVYRLRWLHTINDTPYLYLINYVRTDLAPDLPSKVAGMESLYPRLLKEYGLKFERAEETVTPVIADFILGRLLEVPVGQPLIKLCRTAVFNQKPTEYSEQFIRPDKMQISFHIE